MDRVKAVVKVAETACQVAGIRSTTFHLVSGRDEVKGLIRAMMSSPVGQINPWLLSAAAATPFLVTVGKPSPSDGLPATVDSTSREGQLYMAEASYATEHGILAAAETGLATCWIGGFSEDDVASFFNLNKEIGERVVAITPIGLPADAGPLSWERLMRRISRNRNPLGEMVQADGSWWDIPDDLEYQRRRPENASVDPSEEPTEMGRLLAMEEVSFNRQHTGIAPDNSTLLNLLQAGRLAPSACNSQTWRFRLIQEQATKERIGTVMGFTQAAESGLICIASGVPGLVSGRGAEQPFYMIDVPIAVAHLVLAAVEQNLTVKLRWVDKSEHVATLKDVCSKLDHLGTTGGYKGETKEQPVAVLALSAETG